MAGNAVRAARRRTGRASTMSSIKRSYTPKGRIARLPAALSSFTSEVYAVDLPLALYNMNTTAVITPLNLIRAGSSFNNRLGRKLEMINVRVVGQVLPIRTAVNNDYCRIMIIYDRQTNGALPAIADILQTTDQALANTTTSSSGANMNNRDRFLIIRDTRLQLPTLTDTAGVITNNGLIDPVSTTFNIDLFAKLPGLVTQYKADSAPAVIGDIASGGLYLVTFGAATAGTEGWAANLEVRLRYNP